ncbi:MAG TPA: pyridoxal-phosphate dependent enzyme [Myxococcota bacterium]|nr:pyridoxal-phosphate dependent enzyme [Myxococcota bacterium]
MADPQLALFRAYPAAREKLPRAVFVKTPTPVGALELDRKGLAGGRLYVKRDERSCLAYGGNKPRKLEFVIGDALQRGARTLVTTGGLGTNHGLATTILGRAAGLSTILVLVHQPVTEAVRETLLLQAAYGARQVYGANVPGAALQTLRVLMGSLLRGDRPLLVPTGGSSARGNLGFVSAGLELAEQVRAGALPEPEQVYVPVGSGGTLAGLVLGLRLARLRTRAVGVLVSDILPPSPARLARAARRTLTHLRRADPSVPALTIIPSDFSLLTSELGPGYGAPTPAALEAVELAARAGLSLDVTYAGKCLAAIVNRARRGELGHGPILFWNTYNAVDIAVGAPRRTRPEELPRSIRRVLARTN